jgi:DNA-binding NarL/FixJ family response regulator
MQKLRTVIIEDEIMFRQLLRSTLKGVSQLEIAGEFGLGQPGLSFCLREKPNLLIVDLVLPDMHGMEIIAAVRRAVPDMRILVITAHPSERLPAELITLGVGGYVDKSEPLSYVLNAIETINRGGMYFATHVGAKRATVKPVASSSPIGVALTPREQEIARLVAAGRLSREIAQSLDLGVRTVEKHRGNIMKKVGVHEVASLTRWCVQTGLVEP